MVRALAIVGALTMASCGTPSPDGPIAMSNEESTVCGTLPKFSDAALGVNLPTGLPADLRIDSVEALNPQGLAIAESYLMPVADGYRLLLDTFPPVDQFPDAWKTATRALGQSLPEGSAVDLVVEVLAQGTGGSLDGVRITYTVDGKQYRVDTHMGLELKSSGCD